MDTVNSRRCFIDVFRVYSITPTEPFGSLAFTSATTGASSTSCPSIVTTCLTGFSKHLIRAANADCNPCTCCISVNSSSGGTRVTVHVHPKLDPAHIRSASTQKTPLMQVRCRSRQQTAHGYTSNT